MENIKKLAELKKNKNKRHFIGEAEVVCVDDVPIDKIDWLWPERIACGKITVIAGSPGLGKSQITANLAATITRSLKWQGTEKRADMGSVIFLSAEDDVADTIKPRLVAAGANVKLCHVLKAIKIKNSDGQASERTLDLTQDINLLGDAIKNKDDVRMVIIDPISAYLGKTDSNNNADRCLTIHASKGMEFDHVYLMGMSEDNLPSFQSKKTGDTGREMQEERRNCFVAITRAIRTLTLSYAKKYNGWPKTASRFLKEMGLNVQ